jgi:hypothetical protein
MKKFSADQIKPQPKYTIIVKIKGVIVTKGNSANVLALK